MKDKSILFINYFFPPIHVIGSIRNYNVAINALEYFEKVDVLSTTNKYLYPKNELSYGKLNVTLLPTFDFQTIRFFLKKFKKNSSNNFSSKTQKRSLKEKLRFVLSKYPFNILFGEGGFLYIIVGIIILLIRHKKYDYVYSSYSPHSDHFLAYFLKLINPKVKWIADFRDLPFVHLDGDLPDNWEQIPNNKHIKKADLVTSVSNGITSHFERLNMNTYTLRNGISEHLKQYNSLDDNGLNTFVLSYTGGLYNGVRDPSPIFKALRLLINQQRINPKDLEINYAGRDSSIWETFIVENELEGFYNYKGVVTHKESIEIQRRSHINILLTWATPSMKGVLTGKFYEYLFVERPIILIINGEEDREFEEIFDELNAGIIGYNDQRNVDDLMEYIFELYEEWKTKKELCSRIDKEKRNKYNWDYIAKNFYNTIHEKFES